LTRALACVAVVAALMAACSSSPKHTSAPTATTPPTIVTPPGLPVVTVSAQAAQRIDGFGASGAWWPNDLIHFPKAVRERVADMLFSASGIALSGYRYNIGGGGKGVTDPARAPHEFPTDAAGRTFLQLANRAHVPILTAFVNSAPPQFTTNGQACGGDLAPGSESEYAQYLTNIVRTLHDDDHVTINYVSPMNEPDDSFAACGQEGMRVPVAQRAPVVQALGKALAASTPYARVIADETTADSILATEAPQWLGVPGTTQYLAAIAHHTYDFPNDALRRALPLLSKRFGVPTWMTEICCYKGSGGVAQGFGSHYDPTMTQGLWLADQIESDLTVAGDHAWYWWTALSAVLGCDPKADPACPAHENNEGINDGLLYYDGKYASDGDTDIFVTKRFFVMGQFSRYVRPGAVRHDVAGLPPRVHAMAFAAENTWTVVVWNEGATVARFSVALPATPARATNVFTDVSHDLAPGPPPAHTSSGAWLVELPTGAVATYTFG
jgi:O-glycosyl hydrolase